jgi:hypothetical protein
LDGIETKCSSYAQEIDFVIDADKIPAAANALVATGHFHRCADRNCLELKTDRCKRDDNVFFQGNYTLQTRLLSRWH